MFKIERNKKRTIVIVSYYIILTIIIINDFVFVQVFTSCQRPIMRTTHRRIRVRPVANRYRQSVVGLRVSPSTLTIITLTITTTIRLPLYDRPAMIQR